MSIPCFMNVNVATFKKEILMENLHKFTQKPTGGLIIYLLCEKCRLKVQYTI